MKRRGLALLLTLVLMLGLVPMGTLAADGVLSGDGSAERPYQIADAADLKAFRDKVNGGERTACAQLIKDIDLGNDDWVPIGKDYTASYQGTFDGKNKKVDRLYIDTADSNQGLFGYVDGGTIRDVNVTGRITSTKNNVGGIVGIVNTGTIENCSFSGTVTGGYTGGIVGGLNNKDGVVIQNCVNTATVTGTYAGGILGYSKKKAVVQTCYNTGKIAGSSRSAGIAGQLSGGSMVSCYNIGDVEPGTYTGGIYGFSNADIASCYYEKPVTQALGGTAEMPEDANIGSSVGLLKKLNSNGFVADTGNINNGYPILAWQANAAPAPQNPHIEISGSTTLQMGNTGSQPTTPLTAVYKDMDRTPEISWSVKENSDVVALTSPNPGADHNQTVLVTAKNPGKAVIVASAEGVENAEITIQVVPFVTTVEIKHEKQPGAVAIGQTVKAHVFVFGGGEYDTEKYPALTYQWYRYDPDSNTTTKLSGATDVCYTISDGFVEGSKLGVEVRCNGQLVHDHRDQQEAVRSADYGKLYPVAYDEAFVLPADIKEDGALTLPAAHTKDGVTASIVWTASDPSVIGAAGQVIRPAEGTAEVTLTGRFAYGDAVANRTFSIKVWSDAAANADANDKQKELKQAIQDLGGDGYKLYPVYGTGETPRDTNVIAMLQADLAKKNHDGIAVSIQEIQTVYGGAGIAEDGAITYFYADPNTAPAIRFGSYNVTFTLSKGGETLDQTVPVIVYWDGNKVKDTMTSEILNQVTEDAIKGENTNLQTVSSNLTLPKVVDGKKWTQIQWESSDENVIAVSREKQATADTLFEPFVGVVKPGETDQQVTLTATFTFQLTTDVGGNEAAIVQHKVFSVTVPKMNAAQAETIRKGLEAKLDAGFRSKGLRDAVTGQTLSAGDDGVYTVTNDIQFPTTRDFGVDGKDTPITITSSKEDVVVSPDGNNAARASVLRPAVGQNDQTVDVTVSIRDKDTSVTASRVFKLNVNALTQSEIDSELALIADVKAQYFRGIQGSNSAADNITGNLAPFQEVYEQNGQLVWVRDSKDLVNHGIVPTAMEGWEDLEAWRLFQSSNPAVITHENLLVTRQAYPKAVTITSALSSETLGKYGELYQKDPVKYKQYAGLSGLYNQSVTADLLVRGTVDPISTFARVETVDVSFRLNGVDETWITTTLENQDETTTVYDVFVTALKQNGYTYNNDGKKTNPYIRSITTSSGKTLAEFDYGENSGWMYKVNGKIPDVVMGAYGLRDGDKIQVFYTKDYTKETDDKDGSWGGGGSSTGGTSSTTTDGKGGAKVSVTAKEINAAVEAAQKNHTDTIVIQPAVQGNPETLTVELPASAVKDVAQSAGVQLAIKTGQGTVTLSNEALISAAEQGSTVAITVRKQIAADLTDKTIQTAGAVIVQVTVSCGGQKITQFGGHSLTVALPVDSKTYTAGQQYKVVVLSDDGAKETLIGTCVEADGALLVQVTVQHLSTFVVTTEKADLPFTDLAGHWGLQEVTEAWGRGLMNGVSDTRFAPDSTLNRAMAVTMLHRLAGTPAPAGPAAFSDVAAGQWYSDGIAWASGQKIAAGVGEDCFAPENPVTREQLAVLLYRYAQTKGQGFSGDWVYLLSVSDRSEIADWAYEAVCWMHQHNILRGRADSTIDPKGTATRAEAAALFLRLAEALDQ